MKSRVRVLKENETGRNEKFRDNVNKIEMTRNQFVKAIERGEYENYHIRTINNIKTPVSNPDKSTNNNLG